MLNIEINNPAVKDYLHGYKEFILDEYFSNGIKKLGVTCPDHERDRWLADDYRERIMERGSQHDGYPESIRIYQGIMPDNGTPNEHNQRFRDRTQQLNNDLMLEISAKKNSLASTYPPGGWISWHNNANASGYNILFTWSMTGDGWFDYWDLEKKERVRVPDVHGWQCKMGYFGSYDQPDKLCYHAASTNCLRITVAYVFAEADEFWKYVVEDIQDG